MNLSYCVTGWGVRRPSAHSTHSDGHGCDGDEGVTYLTADPDYGYWGVGLAQVDLQPQWWRKHAKRGGNKVHSHCMKFTTNYSNHHKLPCPAYEPPASHMRCWCIWVLQFLSMFSVSVLANRKVYLRSRMCY